MCIEIKNRNAFHSHCRTFSSCLFFQDRLFCTQPFRTSDGFDVDVKSNKFSNTSDMAVLYMFCWIKIAIEW